MYCKILKIQHLVEKIIAVMIGLLSAASYQPSVRRGGVSGER